MIFDRVIYPVAPAADEILVVLRDEETDLISNVLVKDADLARTLREIPEQLPDPDYTLLTQQIERLKAERATKPQMQLNPDRELVHTALYDVAIAKRDALGLDK